MSKSKAKVNHPKHYGGDTTYEVIKVLEAWKLGPRTPTSGFNLGNAIKYIARAGVTDSDQHDDKYIEDLRKARWYLQREIDNSKVKK